MSARSLHRLVSKRPKLWCVAHYGYENWFGEFTGYVGDGVTTPSRHLVGVYDTEDEAKEALAEAEAGDQCERPEYHDAYWRSRTLEVQPFRPADFLDRQSIETKGIDAVNRGIIRAAGKEGLWHAETPPEQVVETLLIVYAILDVSGYSTYGEVYDRLDGWSQDMAANRRWDDSFLEYDPESWEVDGQDVRRALKRSDRTRVEVESGERRLFRLAYSRDDENCWGCEGMFEIDYKEGHVYDLIYDLECGEEILDTSDSDDHVVAEALMARA